MGRAGASYSGGALQPLTAVKRPAGANDRTREALSLSAFLSSISFPPVPPAAAGFKGAAPCRINILRRLLLQLPEARFLLPHDNAGDPMGWGSRAPRLPPKAQRPTPSIQSACRTSSAWRCCTACSLTNGRLDSQDNQIEGTDAFLGTHRPSLLKKLFAPHSFFDSVQPTPFGQRGSQKPEVVPNTELSCLAGCA